uniref:SLIT and NTRK-like family, member 6 n=2 Tax=Scleropages formosus TaxID=113540 RepID=A0A8C9R4C5_SCLFO
MLGHIIFMSSFLSYAMSPNVTSKESPQGSCNTLCTCTEKDGVWYINCEEQNIDKISKVKIPQGIPFHLSLYSNDLMELLQEDIEGLKNAVSLNLGANSLQQLEPGIFSALNFLKKLHINRNSLATLKENTFEGLVSLEYLQADTNFIQVIEPGAFSKLIRLKVLILNDNFISVLPSNVFRFVPLTHLDLRGNQLQSLPYVGFLEHIGRIMELLLEDNDWVCDCQILPLKIWMENTHAQAAISEVVCSSPPYLKGTILSKAKKDDLCPSHSEADLDETSRSLHMVVTPSSKATKLPKLMDVKDDAKIPTQPYVSRTVCTEKCSCFNSPTAEFLVHCEDKGIQKISDLGLLNQSPTNLMLTGNMIQRLSLYDFTTYESLKLLNLANNQIDYIDNETFLSLGQLKELYLNGNRLDRLFSGMFVGLSNLEYLYLEYNVIKNIQPGTFRPLLNLKLLFLNNNQLQTLPPHIFHHVPLAKLNLMDNLFKHLPVSNVLDQLISLSQISLDKNPWDCSCDLVDLKQWTERLSKDIVMGNITCHTPRKTSKTDLGTLTYDVMCPGLVAFSYTQTNGLSQRVTTTATPTSSSEGFLSLFTETVPLSVLILSLLIFFLLVIFCAAGIVVLVVRQKKRSKKKQAEDQSGEGSPVQVQYNACSHKDTHNQNPAINVYEEPRAAYGPIIQVCGNSTCFIRHKDHELENCNVTGHRCSHICALDKETGNDAPLIGPHLKFRLPRESPSNFVTLGNASSLYQHLMERERELQQIGLAEYLRKNISQLQPTFETQGQARHEDLNLMETLMYAKPQMVMLDQTKNEYLELKANLYKDPDYLEVVEHQTTFN